MLSRLGPWDGLNKGVCTFVLFSCGSFSMCSGWGHTGAHFLHALIYSPTSSSLDNINQALFQCLSLEGEVGDFTSPRDSGKPLFWCPTSSIKRVTRIPPWLWSDVNGGFWVCGLVVWADKQLHLAGGWCWSPCDITKGGSPQLCFLAQYYNMGTLNKSPNIFDIQYSILSRLPSHFFPPQFTWTWQRRQLNS